MKCIFFFHCVHWSLLNSTCYSYVRSLFSSLTCSMFHAFFHSARPFKFPTLSILYTFIRWPLSFFLSFTQLHFFHLFLIHMTYFIHLYIRELVSFNIKQSHCFYLFSFAVFGRLIPFPYTHLTFHSRLTYTFNVPFFSLEFWNLLHPLS